jgi:hypothetical protein
MRSDRPSSSATSGAVMVSFLAKSPAQFLLWPAQGLWLSGYSIFRALLGLLPDGFEDFRQSGDEIG